MLKKVGFIGLGQMGKWMALNLLKSEFELTVFDRDVQSMASLSDHGAQRAASPAELARNVDLVILCLPGPAAIEQVVWEKDGVVAGLPAGRIVVDCGTSDYNWTLNFAAALQKQSIRFADAPVTGMEARARQAILTIMYGGNTDVLVEINPALEAMGNHIVCMGGVGAGQLAKLINQLLFNANLATLAEVLSMAVKLGLEPAKIAQVVNTGSGRSFASEVFLPNILEDRFDQGYSLQNGYKDMISASNLAAVRQIPLPMVNTAMTTYQMALQTGLGDEDKGAMIKVFERLLKVKFRQPKETVSTDDLTS